MVYRFNQQIKILWLQSRQIQRKNYKKYFVGVDDFCISRDIPISNVAMNLVEATIMCRNLTAAMS